MNQQTSPMADKTDTYSVGPVLGAFITELEKVPKAHRLEIIRAMAGFCGHRVLAGSGAVPLGGAPASTSPVQKTIADPKKRKRTPEEIEFQKSIKIANTAIKNESKKLGNRLPLGHPLLQERERLFREHEATKIGAAPRA
jgi:hypothetical protein